ncbi:cobalamin-binding protein [Bacteroidetes bacterium UKL13-3]|nr:cobalamin-binding protein [Bacteroidetes bacterium UKL13-3]HCP94048.1 B12-binding domain-containing radical SAM protein [Bacteroidota bacterium]
MKVLLTTLNAKYIHLNLAIRLLYELNKHREGLDWREFTIKENPNDIAEKYKDFDVVAFSCYIWNITQTLATARALKKLNPNIKIMLGGPEVSYEYNDVITLPEVDYIILGEGEIPFAEFLDAYPNIESVGNLVYKNGEEIKLLPKQVMFDLENYRGINPYKNDAPEDLYNKVCYIETSRGCPYKCEFCLASLDNKVRTLPIEDIKSNLLYLMNHGRVIKFLDRTFNVKKDFTIDMFNFILEHHKPGNVFQFEITADIVHPDIVKYIQEHVPEGLFRFEIGIQTVNQKANLQVSRKQNFDKTSAVIKQLDNKIEMHLDLIVGLPLDEWADIKYSIEEVFKLYPPELQLGFLKFLRGTPVRQKYKEHGYIFDPLPPYQIIESNYLTRDELYQITLLEEALEIYWNKKRAIHTLKYVSQQYSIFDFLLGLGKYFGKHKDFHKHTLNDVYNLITAYSKEAFHEDKVLQQLIAIDYYLQAKIKPQIQYLTEIDRVTKTALIKHHSLNHHKYRHVIVPITFDFKLFLQTGVMFEQQEYLIFEYNGVSKAQIISKNLTTKNQIE